MSDGNLPNKAPDVHPAPKEEDMTLARYGGEKPAAPDWFNWAIAQEAQHALAPRLALRYSERPYVRQLRRTRAGVVAEGREKGGGERARQVE